MKYIALLVLVLSSGCATLVAETKCWRDVTWMCESHGEYCRPAYKTTCITTEPEQYR